MRTITLKSGDLLHIETPNGIVNIRAGLSDMKGRAVDSVQTIPDEYAGELPVRRVPARAANVRLIRLKHDRAARQ